MEGFGNNRQEDPRDPEDPEDPDQEKSTNTSFVVPAATPIRVSTSGNVNPDNKLNPTLRQTTTKYITINSQYRLNSYPYNSNPYSSKGVDTNFTCTLTESLRNVLSLQLHSVYIPESWYTFDPYIGNTVFWIYYATSAANFASNTDISNYQIEIGQGTYKVAADLVTEINTAIQKCTARYQYHPDGSLILDLSGYPVVAYDLSGLCCGIKDPTSTNSRIGFINYSPYFIRINYWTSSSSEQLEFLGNPQRNEVPCSTVTSYEQNLGYYLGARILDLPGTTQTTLTQSLPPLSAILSDISATVSAQWAAALTGEYFAAMNAHTALGPIVIKTSDALILAGTVGALGAPGWPGGYVVTSSGTVINNFYTAPPLLGGPQFFQLILDEYHQNYPVTCAIGIAPEDNKLDLPTFYTGPQPQTDDINNVAVVCADVATNSGNFLPTWPRTATQAQIYALNEIIANRKKPNLVKNDPVSPNLFATVYIPDAPSSTSKTVAMVNNDAIEKRTYFGPVTIDRLQIKLIDNRGNIVNLHGNNWSFTLAVETLYQY